MFSKLSWKLTLYMVLVSGLTIFFAGALTDLALDRQFSTYLDVSQQEKNQKVVQTVLDLYGESGDLAELERQLQLLGLAVDAEIIIEPETGPHHMGHMGRMMGGGSRMPMHRQTTEQITFPNGAEAAITVNPIVRPENTVHEATFRKAVNKSIFLAAFLSVGAALIISSFFSWGLTKPLNQLLTMVRGVGQGDLEHRVEFSGDNEISFLGNEFNQMAENLKKMENLRIKLTNDVAHELRTPLASIQAYAEAMSDGVLEATPRNLQMVLEETERLGSLLTGLQRLAQAETPMQVKERVDLGELASDLASSLGILAAEKNIVVDLNAPGGVVALGDPAMLATALQNVMLNAIKYTPSGGHVSISLKTVDDWSVVDISDTGIGIETQELPLIFERFYRTDLSRSRETGGTGIGLAITAEIIKGHGGTITVQSQVGLGSTFTIRLPKFEQKIEGGNSHE